MVKKKKTVQEIREEIQNKVKDRIESVHYILDSYCNSKCNKK